MKVLFITIGQIQSLQDSSVHIDIINALKAKGHDVSVLCTREKRLGLPTEIVEENGVKIVRLKVGNLTQCSIIEKGITTITLENTFKKAVKKYFRTATFDLIIYNTPPITLANVIKYCKKKYPCKSYLMLKDIFPQNAVDIHMMSTHGLIGIMYKLFKSKERHLYAVSDRIGCMSQANIDYIALNNPEVDRAKLEIFPNAVRLCNVATTVDKHRELFANYGVDPTKTLFVYGGNLGKPQGLDFLAQGIKACQDITRAHFIIVGNGSEKKKLFDALSTCANATCLDALPVEEYLSLARSCDVGLIMLDYRFTIPNYPSRTLSYMESGIPILACTDKATDIRTLVGEEEANCGKWCFSDDILAFKDTINWFSTHLDQLPILGANGKEYLLAHFNTDICVEKLEKFIGNKD